MSFEDWRPLLGEKANSKGVVDLLVANGVHSPVTLGKEDLTVNVDLKSRGMSIGFTSEYVLRGGVADLPILSSIVMKVVVGKAAKGWTPYTGTLPLGLGADSSRDAIVALLGAPASSDDDFQSARWTLEGNLSLGVQFADEWKRIKQIGLSLPRMH